MGPVFYQKILEHGSTFLTEPKLSGFRMVKTPKNCKIFEKWAYFSRKILKNGYPFLSKSPLKMTEPKLSGFRMAKTPKNSKIFEKWAYFSRKILKNGYPFLSKSPLKMGRGFEARAAYPIQLKSEYPSRGRLHNKLATLVPSVLVYWRTWHGHAWWPFAKCAHNYYSKK